MRLRIYRLLLVNKSSLGKFSLVAVDRLDEQTGNLDDDDNDEEDYVDGRSEDSGSDETSSSEHEDTNDDGGSSDGEDGVEESLQLDRGEEMAVINEDPPRKSNGVFSPESFTSQPEDPPRSRTWATWRKCLQMGYRHR